MKKILATTCAFAILGAGISSVAMAGDYSKDKKDAAHSGKMHGEKYDKKDIVDTAMADDTFSTLVAAVKAADLVDALKAEGPLTVFAPTNEAFAKLPEGTVEDLLKPENKEKLQDILKYHVISGKIKSKDIADGSTNVDTLEGTTATVVKGADGVTINGAKVIKADVKASNGVIHVIDTVIMPK